MFNEESQIPEYPQGHDEVAVKTPEGQANEPSQTATNRYNVPAWLQRRFIVKISEAGNPYFAPIESRMAEIIRDADVALDEGRRRQERAPDTDRAELVNTAIEAAKQYHDSLKALVGPDRQWKADQLVLWPLSDEVGYQIFAALNGELELDDYADYLLRTDPNVNSAEDVERHDKFAASSAWTSLAYDELGEYDRMYAAIAGDAEYNVQAIVRKGYSSHAQIMGRKYLQGNTGSAPASKDGGDNSEALAELRSRRRYASAS